MRGNVARDTLRRLAAGIELEDGPMRPTHVSPAHYDSGSDESALTLVLREGRKREVRRAMLQLGHRVVRLVRVRMGPLELGALPLGTARELSSRELRALHAFARARQAASRGGSRGGRDANPPRARGESRDHRQTR